MTTYPTKLAPWYVIVKIAMGQVWKDERGAEHVANRLYYTTTDDGFTWQPDPKEAYLAMGLVSASRIAEAEKDTEILVLWSKEQTAKYGR